MAFNPNAIYISHSILGDFQKCPQRYYYQSVFRTPRGYKIQIINPSLALGESVHDTLEQFTHLPLLAKTKDELLKTFARVWQNFLGDKGGFSSADEESELRQRAINMLERFFTNSHFLETEPLKMKDFPQADLGNDLILVGKFDWVERAGDGYHIIDFKTGKNEEKEDSRQLPIYALLLSRLLGTEKIKTSYWYLDKDADIVNFPPADLQQTLADLRQMGELIKMYRQTKSFRCQSGLEACWACRAILAVAQGKGKLVNMNSNRKQEIYILPQDTEELPF